MVSVYLIIGALVLVTNTRRPAGIDPNVGRIDPFSLSTDDLWKEGMPERRAVKRRVHDQQNAEAAARLIEHFERDDASRPPPEVTPDWALDLQQQHTEE